MSHESFHAREMYELGFVEYVKDAPLKGTNISDYTDENWIRFYKREKYVHDYIIKKAGFNNKELFHNFINLDYYLIQLEKRGININ